MTSDRHSQGRKELNEKRTVALLSMMAFGLSQKCNTFHGQLLIRSGLSGNALNSERVLGTSVCEREYQPIKAKDSEDHHKIVDQWIDKAIEEERLTVLNIDDYTNIHTKKRPIHDTSTSNKMCTLLLKRYEIPTVEKDAARSVNNPSGVLLDELVSNMSSNGQITMLCSHTFTTACQKDAPWITNRFFENAQNEWNYANRLHGVTTTQRIGFQKGNWESHEYQDETVQQNVNPSTTWGLASPVLSSKDCLQFNMQWIN